MRALWLSLAVHAAGAAIVLVTGPGARRGASAAAAADVVAFTLAAVLPSETGAGAAAAVGAAPRAAVRSKAGAKVGAARSRRAAVSAHAAPVDTSGARTITSNSTSTSTSTVAATADAVAHDADGYAPGGPNAAVGADGAGASAGETPAVALNASGGPPGPGAPPAALTPEDRRRVIERYLRDVLTPRIRAHTIYPEEAERLGLEDAFVVRISVDGRGGLVDARLLGRATNPLLKQSAFLALRTSAPWPPPPAVLGALVQIDVPFVYRLDG